MEFARLTQLFHYPFPTLYSPFIDEIQEHTERVWIDGELQGVVSPEITEEYKRVKTGRMASFWYPTATWERLLPLARLYLWSLYNDEMGEQTSRTGVQQIREGSVAVLRGQKTGAESGVVLGDQLEKIRNELLQFLPERCLQRLATHMDRYYAGQELEAVSREEERFFKADECLDIREQSLMSMPFFDIIEVDSRVVLPEHVHDDPIIQRLKVLQTRLMICMNDVQSLEKDERNGQHYYNLTKCMEHEYGISRAEAIQRVITLHDEYAAEYLHLMHHGLPDLEEWNYEVTRWVHRLSLFASGWLGAASQTTRYD
ncbi:terpene synthase family protein [Streptomyces sp. NRRL B-1347]|uniref:terpene synthase family protein n=1 Tax=Streptomyces sp. NRRL B-1347 TaxID=1476877 RepID=UPI0004C6E4DD|nr:terpene synthase family protein [Streptomyces sp. NRRL B-1347]